MAEPLASRMLRTSICSAGPADRANGRGTCHTCSKKSCCNPSFTFNLNNFSARSDNRVVSGRPLTAARVCWPLCLATRGVEALNVWLSPTVLSAVAAWQEASLDFSTVLAVLTCALTVVVCGVHCTAVVAVSGPCPLTSAISVHCRQSNLSRVCWSFDSTNCPTRVSLRSAAVRLVCCGRKRSSAQCIKRRLQVSKRIVREASAEHFLMFPSAAATALLSSADTSASASVSLRTAARLSLFDASVTNVSSIPRSSVLLWDITAWHRSCQKALAKRDVREDLMALTVTKANLCKYSLRSALDRCCASTSRSPHWRFACACAALIACCAFSSSW
mmetsp:Transcript_48150/g.112611  ORF Transcript_48150/g.112611 Transcript_48150/m.112611 type:complete len:332 (-) Transcript_48150:807-1802(-)